MEFIPGPYKKGDVVTVAGVQWVADRDIAWASSLPRENMYWSLVKIFDIQAEINKVPEWGRATIIIPDGDHYLDHTIVIHNRGIHLIGGANANLYFNGVTGIKVSRTHSAAGRCHIENLFLRCRTLRSTNTANGIECSSVTRIDNCTMKNFGGAGMLFYGEWTNGTDSSNSVAFWCEAVECGDGFLTSGGDANAIAFYSCSARDCDRVGFTDNSFLGCSYYSPMTHACHEGGYATGTHGNNRTVFIAAYSEGGQPPSKIDGVTYVFGGICGYGAGWVSSSPNTLIYQQ